MNKGHGTLYKKYGDIAKFQIYRDMKDVVYIYIHTMRKYILQHSLAINSF